MAIDMKYKKCLELDVFKQMRKAPSNFFCHHPQVRFMQTMISQLQIKYKA